MKKAYSVPDMECSMCVMHLEALEDEIPGIRSVKASYHQQRMEVDFDETVVDEETIIKAIKEKGYTVVNGC